MSQTTKQAGYQSALTMPAPVTMENDPRLTVVAPGLNQSIRGAYVYDLFDRADGALNGMVCPTGQTWQLSGTGYNTTTLTGGTVVCLANTYSSLYYGAKVKRVAGVFHLSTTDGPAALIAQNGTNLANMIHFQFTNKGGTLTKRVAGGAFVGVGVAPKWDLRQDGTKYGVAIEVNYTTNVVTIIGPDGVRYSTAPDADFATIAADTGTWQGSFWDAVEMGERTNAEKFGAISNSAPAAEVTAIRGAGVGFTHPSVTFTGTTAGWYRVLVNSTGYASFAFLGTMRITATTPSYNSAGEFVIGGDINSAWFTNGVNQRWYVGTGGLSPVVTQARVTWDGSTLAYFDLYIAQVTGGATVTINFSGYGELVAAPVVGATVLSGGSSVYTFDLNQNNLVPSQVAGFSRVTLGGLGSFSPQGNIDIRFSMTGNRFAYQSLIGGGNFTGSIEWGVNSLTSDADALRVMRLNGTGLLVGTSGNPAAPFHAYNALSTSSKQIGFRLESNAGSGNTIQSIDWVDGLGVGASIDALREGAGFGHSLRFWTMNASGTPTQVATIDSAGRLILTAPSRLPGYTVATLPSGTLGDTAFVTDATAPTYNGTLTGGGAVKVRVFHNGAAWVSN